MTIFRILGDLEVAGATIGGPRRRGLLALLLTRPGETSSLDRICDELWDGEPPEGAVGTVRTYVSQFRKLEVPLSIESDASGYRLEVERDDLDAAVFRDRVERSRSADPPARLYLLDEALGLWRGPALAEFRGSSWADQAALPLEALHRESIASRLEALGELGRLDEAVAGLEAATASDPLDERLAALLALTRYRSGRTAEALRGITACRRALAEEIGVDPGPELTDLERRILDRDPALHSPDDPPTADRAITDPSTTATLPEGTVTFLFTDIVGSTALNRRVGDEPYASLLGRHRQLITDAVETTDGRIFGTEGDATFSVFADAADACTAATDIVSAFLSEPWPEGQEVSVRVGLHTGRALLVDDDYTGATVHLAARVASTAHAHQIVASESTVSLTPSLDWRDLGVHRLKDIDRAQRIRQLAAPGLPEEFPSLPTAENVPTNLPDPRDSFIGRAREVETTLDAVSEGPLTTLVGPGGVGKTRLAAESARRALAGHPGGVHFIPLADVSEDDGVEPALRRTMSLPDRSGLDLPGAVRAATLGELSLIVLDNCEHVVEGAATTVQLLLDGCPTVRVLCTSREPLQLRGERVLWIDPLATSSSAGTGPAEELFLDRAEAATGRSVPASDLTLVRELVSALDGLPLAIELAAARMRGLALVDVVRRLDDRFRLLRSGQRGGDDRHQTLEAVIAWSHELLSPQDRRLLNRLSVFAGTFSLVGAEAVCPDDELSTDEVFDGVSRLVDKSLVRLDADANESRYRLLETIRRFGLARLEAAGRLDAVRSRLISWVMATVDRLERDMRTERQDSSIRHATNERDAARTAFDLLVAADRTEEALRIVASVPLDVPRERIRWIDELVPRVGSANPDAVGRANLAAANLAVEMGATDAAVRYSRQAKQVYRGMGERPGTAWAAFLESFAVWANGDWHGGLEANREALDAFTDLDDAVGLANASWMRASLENDVDEAAAWGAVAEQRCRAVDAPTALAHCLEVRALIDLRRDERGEVASRLHAALTTFHDLRHEGCTAHVLEAVAAASAPSTTDPALVAELLGAADRLREVSGHTHRPWEIEGHAAAVTALANRLDEDEADRSSERGREHTLDSAARVARGLLDEIADLRRSSVD